MNGNLIRYQWVAFPGTKLYEELLEVIIPENLSYEIDNYFTIWYKNILKCP